jgi:hypothetical protein
MATLYLRGRGVADGGGTGVEVAAGCGVRVGRRVRVGSGPATTGLGTGVLVGEGSAPESRDMIQATYATPSKKARTKSTMVPFPLSDERLDNVSLSP